MHSCASRILSTEADTATISHRFCNDKSVANVTLPTIIERRRDGAVDNKTICKTSCMQYTAICCRLHMFTTADIIRADAAIDKTTQAVAENNTQRSDNNCKTTKNAGKADLPKIKFGMGHSGM